MSGSFPGRAVEAFPEQVGVAVVARGAVVLKLTLDVRSLPM